MSDENASALTPPSSAPPDDGGAGEQIEFVDIPPDAGARDDYLAECAPPEPAAEKGEEGLRGDTVLPVSAEREAVPEDGEGPGGGEPRPMPAGAAEGLGPHLDELRRRLILSAAAFLPAFAIGLVIYRRLWDILLLPLAAVSPHLLRFQALSPSDGLILTMRVAFAFALVVSTPVWTVQVWSFIAPGLRQGEKRWLHLAFGSGGILFFLGTLAAYFHAVPLALGFLLPLNQSLSGWENSFTGEGYVSFVVMCCVSFGLAFELPLVMLTLGWVGLLTPEGIKSWWRAVVLGVFVLAAVMTPPDPFSQLLLAVPMLVLFLLGYWLVKWTDRQRE